MNYIQIVKNITSKTVNIRKLISIGTDIKIVEEKFIKIKNHHFQTELRPKLFPIKLTTSPFISVLENKIDLVHSFTCPN